MRAHHGGNSRPDAPHAAGAQRGVEEMSQPVLVFDMDGVLADVTESYRETIARTVAHFTGVEISPERIQDYKNRGGFNDDWKLTHHIIADACVAVPFTEVVDHFQRLFLGNGTDGLILRERW